MKRIWFSVLFIALCISVCVCEQVLINNFHSELNRIVIVAEKNPTKENIKRVKNYYEKAHAPLHAICDTASLNELNQAVMYLSVEDKDIGAALATVRTTNDSIYESQQISFANVF